jgi:hypothetical protein
MEQSVRKFLEFNGKAIYFLAKGGHYWIALRPLCDVLQVNYSRQLRTLKSDDILGGAWSLQTIHDASGRLQKMVCLSEKYIYGWLFSIRSESKELITYKRECYNILFDYFHGSITSRETLIREKTKEQVEEERLEALLANNSDYQQLKLIKRKVKVINTQLRELDSNIQKDQLELFKP